MMLKPVRMPTDDALRGTLQQRLGPAETAPPNPLFRALKQRHGRCCSCEVEHEIERGKAPTPILLLVEPSVPATHQPEHLPHARARGQLSQRRVCRTIQYQKKRNTAYRQPPKQTFTAPARRSCDSLVRENDPTGIRPATARPCGWCLPPPRCSAPECGRQPAASRCKSVGSGPPARRTDRPTRGCMRTVNSLEMSSFYQQVA